MLPIHSYVYHGNISALTDELKNHVDVNSIGGTFENTPLHFAVKYGHLEIVKKLLEYSPDIYIRNKELRTVLSMTVYFGLDGKDLEKDQAEIKKYLDICKILLEYEIKIRIDNREQYESQAWLKDIKDKDGNTPCDLLKSDWALQKRLQNLIAEVTEKYKLDYQAKEDIAQIIPSQKIDNYNMFEIRYRNVRNLA